MGLEFSRDEGAGAGAAQTFAGRRQLVLHFARRAVSFRRGGFAAAFVQCFRAQNHFPPGNGAGAGARIFWRGRNSFPDGWPGLHAGVHVGVSHAGLLFVHPVVGGAGEPPLSIAENIFEHTARARRRGGAGECEFSFVQAGTRRTGNAHRVADVHGPDSAARKSALRREPPGKFFHGDAAGNRVALSPARLGDGSKCGGLPARLCVAGCLRAARGARRLLHGDRLHPDEPLATSCVGDRSRIDLLH